MEYKFLRRAWEYQTRSHTEKLVLVCLADHADKKGECFPSYGTIAKETQLHRVTVIDTISEFERRGIVKKEARTAANGHPSSNWYTLNLPPSKLEGGSSPGLPRVVVGDYQGGSPRLPTLEPPVEPPVEPPKRREGKAPKEVVDKIVAESLVAIRKSINCS